MIMKIEEIVNFIKNGTHVLDCRGFDYPAKANVWKYWLGRDDKLHKSYDYIGVSDSVMNAWNGESSIKGRPIIKLSDIVNNSEYDYTQKNKKSSKYPFLI